MTGNIFKELIKADPIAITGIGIISAGGNNPDILFQNAVSGKSSGRWIKFNGYPERYEYAACAVESLDIPQNLQRQLSKCDRCVKFGALAARSALIDALKTERIKEPEKLGVIAGTSRGSVEKNAILFSYKEMQKIPPSFSPNTSIAGLSGAISLTLGIKGPCFTISANCASSAIAIGLAAEQILTGKASAMLAGGAEAPLHPAILAPLENAGILGKHHDPKLVCRPFDITRNGTILGEGSAFVYLERLSSAISRNAFIYGLLAGWSFGSAANSNVAFEEDGSDLVRIIQDALELADIHPEEICYINAHGTGTIQNDYAEAIAIDSVFGSVNPSLSVSSTKPVTGHCLGATAAIEAVISILTLQKKLAPPTPNCHKKDPGLPINVVMSKPMPIEKPTFAMSISSGFWGNKSALIFRLPER